MYLSREAKKLRIPYLEYHRMAWKIVKLFFLEFLGILRNLMSILAEKQK
jgi:hypothetical protein